MIHCCQCGRVFCSLTGDMDERMCYECLDEPEKYPYFVKVPTVRGLMTERVGNKADEERLKKDFPEVFEDEDN